jgi:ribonuclease HII
MSNLEDLLSANGIQLIAGVDEAGRGPCAGPLVIAAIILKDRTSKELARVRDSKVLSAKVRDELFDVIHHEALSCSIIEISPQEIDAMGLHKSNLEGMRRAVESLTLTPEYVLTDGYAIEGLTIPNVGIWKGDQVAISISAASIIAKVHRDRVMVDYDAQYPGYGFAQHKGYITAAHALALKNMGPCVIHRRSFANISALEAKGDNS